MELEKEAIKKLHSTVAKCVTELTQQPTLTPAETKALKDGLEVMDMLECRLEDCKQKELEEMEYSERGYSRNGSSNRSYRNGSYGRSMRMNGPDYGYTMPHVSYEGSSERGYSGDYGVNGWYRSGNDSYHYEPSGYVYSPGSSERRGRGYSRHSIGDRVVEKLETMMDQAGSEYEKEELHRFIRMIREAAD